ncbi:hypothetical protein Taro_004174 [Colocasia esculenta]|uniref:Auxin-responsive protein n=1 Tax=Colocasia esculenta TaxID=4460 RepID=A0A843TU14_COLES|nr:hypothetical protein [Colocasia esculenta]
MTSLSFLFSFSSVCSLSLSPLLPRCGEALLFLSLFPQVQMRRRGGASPSSSIDSSSHPSLSSASSSQQHRDLSTDLRLGLSISTADSQYESSFTSREYCQPDWPAGRSIRQNQQQSTLFVKVYMEGIPIGRKLDLLAHDGYEGLIRTLRRMFRTTICCPDPAQVSSSKAYILTYEDKEGDWMMVGDVPWEMFLTSVKKLKISKADSC